MTPIEGYFRNDNVLEVNEKTPELFMPKNKDRYILLNERKSSVLISIPPDLLMSMSVTYIQPTSFQSHTEEFLECVEIEKTNALQFLIHTDFLDVFLNKDAGYAYDHPLQI